MRIALRETDILNLVLGTPFYGGASRGHYVQHEADVTSRLAARKLQVGGALRSTWHGKTEDSQRERSGKGKHAEGALNYLLDLSRYTRPNEQTRIRFIATRMVSDLPDFGGALC